MDKYNVKVTKLRAFKVVRALLTVTKQFSAQVVAKT